MERSRPKRISLSLYGEQRGSVELLGQNTTLARALGDVLDAETHSLTQRPRYTVSGHGLTRQVEASSTLDDIERLFQGSATDELVLHLGEQARGGDAETTS